MTRCLDCGSERTTDQCPSCGLTSAAAEVVFRRRLVFRTAIFLLGSLAFPYVSQIFPPLDIDLMLIFFGVIFFTALFLAVTAEEGGLKGSEYYAAHPLIAPSKTALALNYDALYPWGRALDLVITGAERTTVYPMAQQIAKRLSQIHTRLTQSGSCCFRQ